MKNDPVRFFDDVTRLYDDNVSTFLGFFNYCFELIKQNKTFIKGFFDNTPLNVFVKDFQLDAENLKPKEFIETLIDINNNQLRLPLVFLTALEWRYNNFKNKSID